MLKVCCSGLFVMLIGFAHAQDTPCECCTYYSLHEDEDSEQLFNPAIIKQNNIRELTIYVTSKQNSLKDTTLKVANNEYKKLRFLFDANGYIEKKIFFNNKGDFNYAHEFTRNNKNQLLTKISYALDKLGNKSAGLSSEKWVYKYLTPYSFQIKQLDDKFVEQPNNKSSYEIFEHDSIGRVIKYTRQSYYEWKNETQLTSSIIQYNDKTHTATSITKDKKGAYFRINTQYTVNQKPLNSKAFYTRKNKPANERIYTYGLNGQLTKLQIKDFDGGSECSDSGNIIDEYNYSTLNLINHIKHSYKNTVCEMRFVYR